MESGFPEETTGTTLIGGLVAAGNQYGFGNWLDCPDNDDPFNLP